MSDGYEFNDHENSQFSTLASSMKFVGLVIIIMGGLNLISIISGNIPGVITGVILIAIGIWTRKAGSSMAEIVNTEGHDISHLMNAITNLGKLYNLQKWLVIILLVINAVAAVLSVTRGAS